MWALTTAEEKATHFSTFLAHGLNMVLGIDISAGSHEVIKEVAKFDDRLVKLALISPDLAIYFFTAYAT